MTSRWRKGPWLRGFQHTGTVHICALRSAHQYCTHLCAQVSTPVLYSSLCSGQHTSTVLICALRSAHLYCIHLCAQVSTAILYLSVRSDRHRKRINSKILLFPWEKKIPNILKVKNEVILNHFLKIFIYYVYSVLSVCVSAGQKRAPDLITDDCEPPCSCWELNSGPLESRQCS